MAASIRTTSANAIKLVLVWGLGSLWFSGYSKCCNKVHSIWESFAENVTFHSRLSWLAIKMASHLKIELEEVVSDAQTKSPPSEVRLRWSS